MKKHMMAYTEIFAWGSHKSSLQWGSWFPTVVYYRPICIHVDNQ